MSRTGVVGLVRGLASAMSLAIGFNTVFSLFGARSNTPPLHGGWEPLRLPDLDPPAEAADVVVDSHPRTGPDAASVADHTVRIPA